MDPFIERICRRSAEGVFFISQTMRTVQVTIAISRIVLRGIRTQAGSTWKNVERYGSVINPRDRRSASRRWPESGRTGDYADHSWFSRPYVVGNCRRIAEGRTRLRTATGRQIDRETTTTGAWTLAPARNTSTEPPALRCSIPEALISGLYVGHCVITTVILEHTRLQYSEQYKLFTDPARYK